MGTGLNDRPNAVVVYNGELIAAGRFTNAGGVAANRIANWNGTVWSALGTGVDNKIFTAIVVKIITIQPPTSTFQT